MKVSDYIVEFLILHGIKDVFGYPGGMVTHLMDSLSKYKNQITAHVNYHEQACAMAACGWAEMTGLPGVAYATSGPGATNLVTGIACAYFDSIPCVFITGQVNTYEQKDDMHVRQKGFQETDIVSIVRPITKEAFMVKTPEDIPAALNQAFFTAMDGRPGPVLIDIPMNVFRGEVEKPITLQILKKEQDIYTVERVAKEILRELAKAKLPVILAGHGIALSRTTSSFRAFVHKVGIPVVTSMIAIDAIPTEDTYAYGMIGAYGSRWANYIIDHSDCILSLGSRLDCRQTGVNKNLFAQNAKILRVDIDAGEMENRTNEIEQHYCVPLESLMPALEENAKKLTWDFCQWNECCSNIREKLKNVDSPQHGNVVVSGLNSLLPDNVIVTTDVGQNQVWVAQSLCVGENHRVLFSGGHGAMGYGLPSAIGAAIASKRPVICIVGDGGFQMNMQELQTVMRENLPVKIILFNNHALGMIHHFQEMYFGSNFVQTQVDSGFTVPDFPAIVKAYGIRAMENPSPETLQSVLSDSVPAFIEIGLPQSTYVFPKLGLNKPIHEQEPAIPSEIMEEVEAIYAGFCREKYLRIHMARKINQQSDINV